jgi:hypothetical protein
MTQNENGSAPARAEVKGAKNSNQYIGTSDNKVTDCVMRKRGVK